VRGSKVALRRRTRRGPQDGAVGAVGVGESGAGSEGARESSGTGSGGSNAPYGGVVGGTSLTSGVTLPGCRSCTRPPPGELVLYDHTTRAIARVF
jgi:hypothetical protein